MLDALAALRKNVNRINKVADLLSTPVALAPEMLPAAEAIVCGSVVLLSGYFENFLKDCMRSFIDGVNGMRKPLSKLPAKMHRIHFEKGARALAKQIKEDWKSGDTSKTQDLADLLASLAAIQGYRLVWEAFADTRSNPGPDVVEEFLRSVGVQDPWGKLRSETIPGKVDLAVFLTSFIEVRNDCAHTGGANSKTVASDLLVFGDNLVALAQATITVLSAQLGNFSTL